MQKKHLMWNITFRTKPGHFESNCYDIAATASLSSTNKYSQWCQCISKCIIWIVMIFTDFRLHYWYFTVLCYTELYWIYTTMPFSSSFPPEWWRFSSAFAWQYERMSPFLLCKSTILMLFTFKFVISLPILSVFTKIKHIQALWYAVLLYVWSVFVIIGK